MTGQGEDAIIDPRGNLLGGLVASEHHFQLGVDVVHMVKSDGLRGAGKDRRSEFMGAVMRSDEMQKVEPHVFVVRSQLRPLLGLFRVHQVAPHLIDELHADRDVAKQFPAGGKGHRKTRFGERVFPEFSAIVKKDADEKKIAIELWVGVADLVRRSHHLGDMLDESASASVVVFSCCSGAPKLLAINFDEVFRHGEQAWVVYVLQETANFLPVAVLLLLKFAGSSEKRINGVALQLVDAPVFAFDAVLGCRPLSANCDEVFCFECFCGGEACGILPGFESHGASRVPQCVFVIRFAGLGLLFLNRINLRVDKGMNRFRGALGFDFGDAVGIGRLAHH